MCNLGRFIKNCFVIRKLHDCVIFIFNWLVYIICLVFLWAIWLFTLTNKQYKTTTNWKLKTLKCLCDQNNVSISLEKIPKRNSPSLSNGIVFQKSSFIDLSELILVNTIFHHKRLFFATYMNGQGQVFTDTLLWSLLFITKECEERKRPVSFRQ